VPVDTGVQHGPTFSPSFLGASYCITIVESQHTTMDRIRWGRWFNQYFILSACVRRFNGIQRLQSGRVYSQYEYYLLLLDPRRQVRASTVYFMWGVSEPNLKSLHRLRSYNHLLVRLLPLHILQFRLTGPVPIARHLAPASYSMPETWRRQTTHCDRKIPTR
jgi:hypothetical protein